MGNDDTVSAKTKSPRQTTLTTFLSTFFVSVRFSIAPSEKTRTTCLANLHSLPLLVVFLTDTRATITCNLTKNRERSFETFQTFEKPRHFKTHVLNWSRAIISLDDLLSDSAVQTTNQLRYNHCHV